MKTLFIDGFDHYTTAQMSRKWNTVIPQIFIAENEGRRNSGCLKVYGKTASTGYYVQKKTIPNTNTICIGIAYKFELGDTAWVHLNLSYLIIQLYDGATQQAIITIRQLENKTQQEVTITGASSFGAATFTYPYGTWGYLEILLKIGNTDGSYIIRQNNTVIKSGSSVDTQVSANAYCNEVRIGFNSASINAYHLHRYDDLYIIDTEGDATEAAMKGDSRVDVLRPVSNISAGWTPTAGTNYQCVDDVTPNDDTDYVYHTEWAQADVYKHGVLSSIGEIHTVQHVFCAKGESGFTTQAKHLIRLGATDYTSDDKDITVGYYNFYTHIWDQNPQTEATWVKPDVSEISAGIKVQDQP